MKLLASSVLLVLVFSVLHEILAVPLTDLTDCTDEEENGKVIKLSIRSKKNESGDWVTSFAAYGNSGDHPDALNLDLVQMVTEKNRKDSVLLQGTFGVVSPIVTEEHRTLNSAAETFEGPIVFHERAGTNIRLSNNGRTAERINPRDDFNDAIVVTDRILKDNELFEVRLDEVVGTWAGSLDFGVTTKKPTELPQLTYSGDYSQEYTWFYGVEEFVASISDDDFKVGDRFGVVRTPTGDVKYYVNGKYIGTASRKVPKEVYGVIDIYGKAVKTTIINPS